MRHGASPAAAIRHSLGIGKTKGLMPLADAYDQGEGQGDVFGGYSEARTRLARRKAKAETEYFEAVDASWASTLTGLGVSQIATRL